MRGRHPFSKDTRAPTAGPLEPCEKSTVVADSPSNGSLFHTLTASSFGVQLSPSWREGGGGGPRPSEDVFMPSVFFFNCSWNRSVDV